MEGSAINYGPFFCIDSKGNKNHGTTKPQENCNKRRKIFGRKGNII